MRDGHDSHGWAATVPEERFQGALHELDELVVAAVAGYTAAVRREVNWLPSALTKIPPPGGPPRRDAGGAGSAAS